MTDTTNHQGFLEALETMNPNSLMKRMGIEVLEASAQKLVARMPVEGNTQPYGLLHGGASVVLAETLGSIGSANIISHFVGSGSAPRGPSSGKVGVTGR